MNVGFFHIGDSPQHLALASGLTRSVRAAMPGVPIIHFTDQQTAFVTGVDSTIRGAGGPVALACLEAYAHAWPEDDWLFVDTDVVIQKDVRHVFDRPFDIAVAERTGTFRPGEEGSKFMARMPFNKGAVFSRSPAFWLAALTALKAMPTKLHTWMGDQQAMCAVIASEAFQVRILPNSYNYPPKRADEDVRAKHILHLKGPRKAWAVAS